MVPSTECDLDYSTKKNAQLKLNMNFKHIESLQTASDLKGYIYGL
jgi:hypothetical protein